MRDTIFPAAVARGVGRGKLAARALGVVSSGNNSGRHPLPNTLLLYPAGRAYLLSLRCQGRWALPDAGRFDMDQKAKTFSIGLITKGDVQTVDMRLKG